MTSADDRATADKVPAVPKSLHSKSEPVRRVVKVLLPGHQAKTAILLSLVGLLYVSALLRWAQPIHGASVVVSADLHTERVSFLVLDPAKAAFFVEGMKGGALGSQPTGECLTGLFTPAKDAVVTYGRRGEGAVEVTIKPASDKEQKSFAGTFQPQAGSQPRLIDSIWFLSTDPSCKRSEAMQFPVWGDVSVGLEFRPPNSADTPEPSMLIDGTIQVAARSAFQDALYEVSSISVPTGARLQAYDSRAFSSRPNAKSPTIGSVAPAVWWGIAYVDPQRTALVTELATETPNIALYRPNRSVADRIGASDLTQLTTDPDIVRVHVLALVFMALVFSCDWAARHWHYWSNHKAHHTAERLKL